MPDDILTKPYVCNFSEKGPIDMECAVNEEIEAIQICVRLRKHFGSFTE
jgi:hypothetical protein